MLLRRLLCVLALLPTFLQAHIAGSFKSVRRSKVLPLVMSLALLANPSPAATQSIPSLLDNFDGTSLNPSTWTVLEGSGILVSGGLLQLQGMPLHTRIDSTARFGLSAPGETGGRLVARARIRLGGDYQKFGFRINPSEFSNTSGFYFDTVEPLEGGGVNSIRAIVWEAPASGPSSPLLYANIPVSWNEFHEFEISRTLSGIIFSIDGQEKVRISYAYSGALPVGIWNDRTQSMQTDWVSVAYQPLATKLAFTQQPSASATAGVAFTTQPIVAVQDASGATVTTDNSTVITLAKASGGSGNLACTGGLSKTVVSGVATFSGCSFDQAGTFTIRASAGSLTPAESNSIVVSPAADLSLTMPASFGPFRVGDDFTYVLTVKNDGPSTATGVTLTDRLDEGLTFVSTVSSQGSCNLSAPPLPASRTVTCNLGSLAKDATTRVEIKVRATKLGTIPNTASVTATEPDPTTPNIARVDTVVQVPGRPSEPGAARRKVVVFLEGIGTDLLQSEIDALKGPCSDPTYDLSFGDIRLALTNMGFVCDDFLRYSYEGGFVDDGVNRTWHPSPYSCEKTGQPIDLSLIRLRDMLLAYRRAHSDTQFVLIGHSLGGVIALEITKFIGQDPLLSAGSIEAVVTIDSPLNHATRQNLLDSRQVLGDLIPELSCVVRLFFSSPVSLDLGDVTDANRQVIRKEKEDLVTTAKERGVRFMTVGNEQDCIWYLTLCNLPRVKRSFGGPLGGDWIDDRRSMLINNANRGQLYPLGTSGCDLATAFDLLCLADRRGPHSITRHDAAVIRDIAAFVGRQLAP